MSTQPGRYGVITAKSIELRAEDGHDACPKNADGTRVADDPTSPIVYRSDLVGGDLCSKLSKDVITADDLRNARAAATSDNHGRPTVQVMVRPASQRRVNALLNACYSLADSCDGSASGDGHGAFVLLINGTIAERMFAEQQDAASSGPVNIAMGLSDDEAAQVVAAING